MEMRDLEEQDVIKRLQEEDSKLLIAFRSHAAYYTVPLSNVKLCTAIREAHASGRAIFFTHKECKILKIREASSAPAKT